MTGATERTDSVPVGYLHTPDTELLWLTGYDLQYLISFFVCLSVCLSVCHNQPQLIVW